MSLGTKAIVESYLVANGFIYSAHDSVAIGREYRARALVPNSAAPRMLKEASENFRRAMMKMICGFQIDIHRPKEWQQILTNLPHLDERSFPYSFSGPLACARILSNRIKIVESIQYKIDSADKKCYGTDNIEPALSVAQIRSLTS
ncbi:hypothetical protein J6590_061087 [Homalodisca vitripennis]|nr:hypothetical protein J6590_061087 [Homalodisca vitripennis]